MTVRVRELHRWDLSPAEAVALQARLAGRVRERRLPRVPRLVAGVDCGYSKAEDRLFAAVVLCRLRRLPARDASDIETVEERLAEMPPPMPYVPGLLSFREAPAVAQCFRELSRRPEAVLIDGQGRAHPRRFGIACHLGLLLGVPTVGCAKSILVGTHRELARRRGSRAALLHGGETVGLALRTREGVRPVYVSVGHLVDLAGAARLTLAWSAGVRLPEPARRAHHLATEARLKVEGGGLKAEGRRKKLERSAGLIVFRESAGRREFLLVRSRRHGAWGFPKGHVLPGETDADAARREAREETGLTDLELLPGFRRELRYPLPGSGRAKRAVYFLARCAASAPASAGDAAEISEVRWAAPGEALGLLTFENTRGLLRAAEKKPG